MSGGERDISDADTGQYVFEPRTIDELAKFVRIRSGTEEIQKLHEEAPGSFGIPFGMDPAKLDEAGWGVIVHEDTPADVRAALEPLIAARKALADERLKILDYKKGRRQ